MIRIFFIAEKKRLLINVFIESMVADLYKKCRSVKMTLVLKDQHGTLLQPQTVLIEPVKTDELFSAKTDWSPLPGLRKDIEFVNLSIAFEFEDALSGIFSGISPAEILEGPENKVNSGNDNDEDSEYSDQGPDSKRDNFDVDSLMWSVDNFSDLSIECQDGSVLRVHQNVVFMKCPTLKALSSNIDESSMKTKLSETPRAVKEAVRFIYSNKVGDIEGVEKDLLELSQTLEIVGLADAVVDQLRAKLSCESAVETLIFSNQNNFKQLKEASLKFVIKNLKEIRQREEFKELENHPELLMEILCRNEVFE